MLSALVLTAAAGAGAGNGNGNAYGRDGVKPVPADVKVNTSKKAKKKLQDEALAAGIDAPAVAATESKTPPVGTVRPFIAVNFNSGALFLTQATLKGVGDKIEV